MIDTHAGTRRQLRDLLATRARQTGEITLSTGTKSNFYFDCKLVTLDAEGAYLAGLAFLDALDQLPERPDAVGGLTLGADPIVSAMIVLSRVRNCPIQGFYVRQQPKGHGTKRLIENPPGQEAKVVIVDDVVTSGRSLLQAVKAAREAGYRVVGAMALVDREEKHGAANIRREVEHFIPIFRRSDFEGTADDPGDRAATRSEPSSISETSPLAASAHGPSSLRGSTA